MPNHCWNQIYFTNVTNEQAQRIIAAAERNQLADEFMPQPDWQNTPNEDGVYPGPVYSVRHYKRRMWKGGGMGNDMCNRFPDGTPDQRWYGWCNANWGTKWGIYETSVDYNEKERTLYVSGNTAWGPLSTQWFEAVSEQLPGVEIECRYEETGCDFYGVIIARDGQANDMSLDISSLKEPWVEQKLSPEKLAIYNDDTHEDYDDVYDEVNDLWWDVESEMVADGQDKLAEQISDSFRQTRHELKGAKLENLLKELKLDPSFLRNDNDLQIVRTAIECGYLPKEFADVDIEEKATEIGAYLKRFFSAITATPWYIDYTVKKSIEEARLRREA